MKKLVLKLSFLAVTVGVLAGCGTRPTSMVDSGHPYESVGIIFGQSTP